MEPLPIFPQCVDCLMSLARDLPVPNQKDHPGLETEAEKRAARIIEEGREKKLGSPEIAKLIVREVIQLTGIPDPFALFKLAVKGGPALDDLTKAELRLDNLERMFDEVTDTETDGPGIDWKHASEEFLALVENTDLIVSKGMANFECLYPRGLAAPLFFLFKVKCEPIQEYLKASADSFVALWKEGDPDRRSSK
jgi:uncharacterized protein with ATP-grasp and redox domains